MAERRWAEAEQDQPEEPQALREALARLAALEALVRALHDRLAVIETAQPAHLASEPPASRPGAAMPVPLPVHLPPHTLQGYGMHEAERDGEARWRWFGPDVGLVLPACPAGATLRLELSAVARGVDAAAAVARLDGVPVPLLVRTDAEGLAIEIPVPLGLESDAAEMVLRLEFAGSHVPPGDDRRLSVACRGVALLPAG